MNIDPTHLNAQQLGELGADAVDHLARRACGTLTSYRLLLGRCLLAMDRHRYHFDHGCCSSIHYACVVLGLKVKQARQFRHVATRLEEFGPLRNSTESGKNLSKLGVQGLTAQERVGLAPEPYEFGPHPESLRKVFEAHAGPVSQEAFERFLKVQTIWEEFMAAQIRAALSQDRMVVVLVGKGHLLHGFGLPQRVQSGWPHPLRQAVVVVNPQADERSRCDLWWNASGLVQ